MNKKQILKKLAEFIAIPSLSGDMHKFHAIKDAVSFLVKELQSMQFEVEIIEKEHVPPLIIGRRILSPDRHTIGIYGHYDVQSEQPIEEWDTNPYELVIKNGNLYARGVADNKGHIIQNLAAVRELVEQGHKINMVCIFEGEEEVGSEHFEELVAQKKDMVSDVDVFYITDNDMFAKGVPQILYALRGLVYFQLNVRTGSYDLHSGVYGNMALNPAQVLTSLVAKMKDVSSGKVLIPGFYDDVRELPADEQRILEKSVVPEEVLIKESGLQKVLSQNDCHPSLVSKVLPSLDVNGMISGFTGEGSKTIIPYQASVKFSCRLVPYQHADDVEKKVQGFVKEHMPKGVTYELETLSKGDPFFTDMNDSFVQKTADIFTRFFGRETVMSMSGGSIGAAEVLQRLFRKPVIVTGFVLPDCRMHGPNEHYDEDMFWKGIEALKEVFKR